MTLFIEKELIKDFEQQLVAEGVEIKKKPIIHFDPVGLVQFLTVGGGLAGLANCVIQFLKLKYQKRSVKIRFQDGSEINVEGLSTKEIEDLLVNAKALVITSKSST